VAVVVVEHSVAVGVGVGESDWVSAACRAGDGAERSVGAWSRAAWWVKRAKSQQAALIGADC
jgi:hypothetical protein